MISPAAEKIIENYLHLPFPGKDVACPYFINKKNKLRGALRALIGKGTPEDIIEEAQICALKEKINLENLSSIELRKFLTTHHLGVDCSALVYYIINAEIQFKLHTSLSKKIYFPHTTNFLKKLITKLRPAENVNVLTFAHEKNSKIIPLSEAQPGDVLILCNAGKEHTYQHIVFIQRVDYIDHKPLTLHYTHSIELNSEDWQNNGVRQGTITIMDSKKPILEQLWVEREKNNEENAFYSYAKTAETITLHRLWCLI